MSEIQAGGADHDPVESKTYTGNEATHCTKCGKSLNKQSCTLMNDGKYCCFDESDDIKPFDAIVCRVIQAVRDILTISKIQIPEKTIKQLEKLIRDLK